MVGDRDAMGDPIDPYEGDPYLSQIDLPGQARLFSQDTHHSRGLLIDVGNPRPNSTTGEPPRDLPGQEHLFAPRQTTFIDYLDEVSGDRPLTGDGN